MRIALLLLCVAVGGGCRPRHADDATPTSTTLIRDEKVPGLWNVFVGKDGNGGLALVGGRPASMHRLEPDGTLAPLGTLNLESLGGGLEYARSVDTDDIWLLPSEAVAAVRWRGDTATRIELGPPPEVKECPGCIIELVGTQGIEPGPDGGAVVVRNFADRKRRHKLCEVVQLSQTGIKARNVFPGFGAPIKTRGFPAVMVSEEPGSVMLVMGSTGWSSRDIPAARSYEGWVQADGALYRLESNTLVRIELSGSGTTSTIPFPDIHPLAIAPTRGRGLWAIVEGASVDGKPRHVLARIERIGQLSTSPALPDTLWCSWGEPEELADERVAVPCRLAYSSTVTSVATLIDGQWRLLRSAEAEARRVTVERSQRSRETTRAIAPWLTKTSPMTLVLVHILFIIGLRLTCRSAARDPQPSPYLRPVAAVIGATAGLLFGLFEKHGSGWWSNAFLSLAQEEWWLAKFTAALTGAYAGVLLTRRDARPRVWRFALANTAVPVLCVLMMAGGVEFTDGTAGSLLIGLFAWLYGFIVSRGDEEAAPKRRPNARVSRGFRPKPGEGAKAAGREEGRTGAVGGTKEPGPVRPVTPTPDVTARRSPSSALAASLPEARDEAREAPPPVMTDVGSVADASPQAASSPEVRDEAREVPPPVAVPRPVVLPRPVALLRVPPRDEARDIRRAVRKRRALVASIVVMVAAAAFAAWRAWSSTHFYSTQFLVRGSLPEGWKSFEYPGSLGFSRIVRHETGSGTQSAAWMKFVTADPEGTLETYRSRPPPTHKVSEVTIDTQPALLVESRERQAYYVKNARGDLIYFYFEEATPADEAAELMADLRFLGGSPVDPDARYTLRGQVTLITGDCMPPHKCKPQEVQREIVIRGAGPNLKPGEPIARIQTDGDGDFRLSLPPGRYHLFVIEDGKEWCTRTGTYGPCGVRIIDRDIETSLLIDRASH